MGTKHGGGTPRTAGLYHASVMHTKSMDTKTRKAVAKSLLLAADTLSASRNLVLGPGRVNEEFTRIMRTRKLRARSAGDFDGAMSSAGFYAKKSGKTMFVYGGNSYMNRVFHVSYKPGDYLNRINNMGVKVFSVSPDLTVTEYDIDRPSF